jgi:hypothetical protein
MTPEQWHALSWDMQETYLSGLAEDPEVPFSREAVAEQVTPGVTGPATRENVDAGTNVFDITAMIADLEKNPDARRRT